MDAGLLLLRIVVGSLLVGHGCRKLFGWFGGGGLAGTAWFFRSVGYRSPRAMAALGGGAELFGGTALAAGLLTPLAAAVVVGAMLNAAVAIHGRHGLWAIDNGYEYPLMTAAAAASLAFTGPGTLSFDAGIGLAAAGIESGLGALALGLAAGSAVLVSRAVRGGRLCRARIGVRALTGAPETVRSRTMRIRNRAVS